MKIFMAVIIAGLMVSTAEAKKLKCSVELHSYGALKNATVQGTVCVNNATDVRVENVTFTGNKAIATK